MLSESEVNACASYVTSRVKHVIETFGPRAPGSEGERRTQEFVREELAAFCDGEVHSEPFQVAGKAFFAMHAVGSALLIASILAWFLHPALSAMLDALALSVWYFQLLRYRLYLDPFFPKSTSCNVYGRIKPKGEIKRRIILSGHSDAACEFRFSHLSPALFRAIVPALLLGLAALAIFHGFGLIAWCVGDGLWHLARTLAWVQFAILPFILLGVFFNDVSRIVPGANDNLSGVFTSVGIAKALKESGVQLENTELIAASLGSEEAGLRGAKAFAAKHKAEFEDVETTVVVLETLRDLDHLGVYDRDMNGTVKHDARACGLLHAAGANCGLDLPFLSIFLGSSDGAAFTQAGWRAAVLAAMDPAPAAYYHTRLDNWDNMSEACLRKVVALVCEAIRQYDAA